MPAENPIPPKGHLTLEGAVNTSGYKPDYLMQLAREGAIARIKQDGIYYFSAKDLREYNHPRGYLTIEEAAEETGLPEKYLGNLARKNHIKSLKKHRRVFLRKTDVEKLKAPEGYLPLEEAVKEVGYVADYLKRLARQGLIRKIAIRGQIYLSSEDIAKYNQNPEGYLSPEEATRESGYSHGGLRRLARNGHIKTAPRHGIVYFYAEDIQKLKVPEGFLSLEEAAKQSEFSIQQIKYKIKTDSIQSTKIGGKRYVSAEDLGIRLEKQENGASHGRTLDGRI